MRGAIPGRRPARTAGNQIPRIPDTPKERPVPTRFAHDLPLQEWVEVGLGGLLAVLAWYVAVATTLVRELAPPKPNGSSWLLAPAVAAFPLANLLDWPWALTGTGVLWAVAVGGLLAWREQRGSRASCPA